MTDEESRAVEDEATAEDLPDWQAEHLPKVREALVLHAVVETASGLMGAFAFAEGAPAPR